MMWHIYEGLNIDFTSNDLLLKEINDGTLSEIKTSQLIQNAVLMKWEF